MRISEYSKRVKTHKASDLLFMLTSAKSSLEDIANTLNRVESSDLGIEAKATSWAISKSVTREVSKVYRLDTRSPYLHLLKKSVSNASQICDILSNEISSIKEKVWHGETLTFKQVAILDNINSLENWVDYTYLTLDVLISEGFGENLNKADRDILNGTLSYYTSLTMSYVKNPSDWKQELDKVPEVEVSEENEGVINASDKLISAMSNNQIGIHRLNPKFWFDLGRSRYDLGRLEALNRYNEQLNMMINLANSKKSGDNDATLESQIEVFRGEINRNRAKQEEIVKRYE